MYGATDSMKFIPGKTIWAGSNPFNESLHDDKNATAYFVTNP